MKYLLYIGLLFGFISSINAQSEALELDKELGLKYHNVSCKEILDGHSFVKDSSISTCADKILKEYVIEANLENAYKEFISKQADKKAFKEHLPKQNLQYEYNNLELYSDTINIVYEFVNPTFMVLSIGYENGVVYYSFVRKGCKYREKLCYVKSISVKYSEYPTNNFKAFVYPLGHTPNYELPLMDSKFVGKGDSTR